MPAPNEYKNAKLAWPKRYRATDKKRFQNYRYMPLLGEPTKWSAIGAAMDAWRADERRGVIECGYFNKKIDV